MIALLVRHGSAHERQSWRGDDRRRPLDDKGRAQAEWLADFLAEHGATRAVSSPFDRCVQTLEPFSERQGLEVELRDELEEGSCSWEVERLVDELGGRSPGDVPALSSHGDVILDCVGHDRPCKKGSVWVVEFGSGGIHPTEYVKPPKGPWR